MNNVIRELAELPPDSIITEQALAGLLHRHPASIRRAVARGELPVPVRMFGKPTWTARTILDHLNTRLEAARREQEKAQQRMARLSA